MICLTPSTLDARLEITLLTYFLYLFAACLTNVHKRCQKNVANNCGINARQLADILNDMGMTPDQLSKSSKQGASAARAAMRDTRVRTKKCRVKVDLLDDTALTFLILVGTKILMVLNRIEFGLIFISCHTSTTLWS